MQEDRIGFLIDRLVNGTILDQERRELMAWIAQNPDGLHLERALTSAWDRFEPEQPMSEEISSRILANIFPAHDDAVEANFEQEPRYRARWMWPKLAAAVVLITFGLYWWADRGVGDKKSKQTVFKVPSADLPPGGNRAILTLGDGSSITLDSTTNGVLTSQGGSRVKQSGKGQLVYQSGNGAESIPVFNTVTTPKGGQYHIVLSDGTGVWLNAASSLRFPTAFKGQQREVEITGEVYFEVAHRAKMPFVVHSGETQVTVLGTHFNVMAYPDEKAMRTTLLEGSVKVTSGTKEARLSPGEQAEVYSGTDQMRVLKDVDVEKELSWKNGYFQFEDESLDAVMRQVARWYDVDVRYEGKSKPENFTGRLPRNANVSGVLKVLELSGVKFRIEDKMIIVTP